MLTIHIYKKLKASVGVTLVEVSLVCALLGIITVIVLVSFMSYSRNQALANDSKLDRQSLQELIRAANNYFAVCPNDSSVTITFLKENAFLSTSASLKEINWNDKINATLKNNMAVSYTIQANFVGKSTNQARYAALLKADHNDSGLFSWQRPVGVFRSYSNTDNEFGSQMGYYIESINNAAKKSGNPGAKPCQPQ